MPPPQLLKIDESNRGAHYYLEEEHECFFFHEYTARKGFAHSQGNGLIINLKKSVLHREHPQYRYKLKAIDDCALMLRSAFEKTAAVFHNATIVPIPPSKAPTHAEYDDRMVQVVSKACQGKGADVRQLVQQMASYEASHTQIDGLRKRPHELEAIYQVAGPPPKATVILVDDVLTTGAHFVAVRNVIRRAYPDCRVLGIFMARRVLSDPADDFDAL